MQKGSTDSGRPRSSSSTRASSKEAEGPRRRSPVQARPRGDAKRAPGQAARTSAPVPKEETSPVGIRLQKALAEAGLGSRRELEQWIRDGRVRVNGQRAQLGDRVQPGDRVRVDSKDVKLRGLTRRRPRVLAYHKPEGEVVTRRDPEGRPTIFRKLPRIRPGRWIAIGRLDLNTAGLLLVTDDGDLANRLMHPSRRIEREYAVRVRGEVSDASLRQLVEGVTLEDGPARFEEIVDSGGSGLNHWYHLVLCEGRNREVRRLWSAVGHEVSRLKRVRFGNVFLDVRPLPGQWRELQDEEVDGLMELAGLEVPRPQKRPKRPR